MKPVASVRGGTARSVSGRTSVIGVSADPRRGAEDWTDDFDMVSSAAGFTQPRRVEDPRHSPRAASLLRIAGGKDPHSMSKKPSSRSGGFTAARERPNKEKGTRRERGPEQHTHQEHHQKQHKQRRQDHPREMERGHDGQRNHVEIIVKESRSASEGGGQRDATSEVKRPSALRVTHSHAPVRPISSPVDSDVPASQPLSLQGAGAGDSSSRVRSIPSEEDLRW
ncbi:unnamed protein product, partial [Discosporangium mesarthrocarpum]